MNVSFNNGSGGGGGGGGAAATTVSDQYDSEMQAGFNRNSRTGREMYADDDDSDDDGEEEDAFEEEPLTRVRTCV